MHIFVKLLGFSIPSYGLIISIGLIFVNLIAFKIIHKTKDDINDFIILEAGGILGAFLGSKLLYILVSLKYIDWNKFNLSYLNQLMQGGFVFWGGLIGFILSAFIFGSAFQINVLYYLRKYIFLVPCLHAFGRFGCFMAGCCYGIPYTGVCAVTFPTDSLGLPNVSLFPVQILEAFILLTLSGVLFFLYFKKNFIYTIVVYLSSYGIIRFFLEFLRYDKRRGIFYGFSVSQWISIGILLMCILKLKHIYMSRSSKEM